MQRSLADSIQLKGVSQSFNSSGETVHLFDDVHMTIEQGRSYSVIGPSGAGKSSLLMLLSGLERPTAGAVEFVSQGHGSSMETIRAQIGFIFQQFHLLPELTTLNNVALPLKLRGIKDALDTARDWLSEVGLEHRLNHKPQQLSGGEQQRAAIARALVFEPRFIFADEPTGNLDEQNAALVADTLFRCCERNGAGLVLVTHSNELASRAEQTFTLGNGKCLPVSNGYRGDVACA